MPALSVLLPYRDAAATIDEAVDGILAEADVDLELVAIDDGSRDDGAARLAALAARHRQVRAISAAPASGSLGVAGALMRGLAVARAPLIGRMDADDVSVPGRLARQVAALAAAPDVAVIGTRVEAFPDAIVGAGLRRYVAWQNELLTPADHRRELFVESPLCHPSVVLRCAALAAVGGWRDGDFPEDYDLWLRLDQAGFGLAKLPEVLLRWRHREGRATYTDPRYAAARFPHVKAGPLAHRLRVLGRPFVIWGAGPTGKRLARALEPHGARPSAFVDIDPRKVGGRARGAPVREPGTLVAGVETVVVAVGAEGARALIRAHLTEWGFVEGRHFLCAA
jgi:glycosyltransferase involved in cell wall biosynthesis